MHSSPLSVLEVGTALGPLHLASLQDLFNCSSLFFWPKLWQDMVCETKLCVKPHAGVPEGLGQPWTETAFLLSAQAAFTHSVMGPKTTH